MDIWNCRLLQYDVEELVTNISGGRSGRRSSAQHAAHQVKGRGYGAESIVIVLARGFYKNVYPSVDFV
jgi:hypothetical protein